MENKISFTGIRNIGTAAFSRDGKSVSQSISMVLCDDFRGADLKDLRTVIGKVANDAFEYRRTYIKPNILNIEHISDTNNEMLMLNGWGIPLNDESMPLFSYIAKLTKRITGMSEKEMVVNKDYVEFEAKNNLIMGVELRVEKQSDFEQFFDKNKVKETAKEINDFIQDTMERYLGIK